MSDGGENTMKEYLANHPKITAALLTTALLLSQGLMIVSAGSSATAGP